MVAKYNIDDGLPAEEHLHNFMLESISKGFQKNIVFGNFSLTHLKDLQDLGISPYQLDQSQVGILLKNIFC